METDIGTSLRRVIGQNQVGIEKQVKMKVRLGGTPRSKTSKSSNS